MTLMKKHWTVSRQNNYMENNYIVISRQHLLCTKKDNLVHHLYGVYMQTIHNEETNTSHLLHAKHAASDFTRILVQSPGTDVLVLCCSQFSSLGATNCGSTLALVIKTR